MGKRGGKKRQNYWQDSYATFINSFKKIDKKIVYVALYDFLFILLMMSSLLVWNGIAKKEIEKIPPELLQNPENLSPENAGETAALMKSSLITIVGSTIALLIFIFMIWCLFKGLIWSTVLRKKFSLGYYGKFLLINLAWFIIWIIPIFFILIALRVRPSIMLMFVIIAIFSHFTNLLYISFTKDNSIKESFKKAFQIGIYKIQFLLTPYVFIIALMVVISTLLWPAQFLNEKAYIAISTLVMVFYIAWARFYLVDVVNKIPE